MAAWGYGLLGPVEVRVDGHAVPLPGARQRLVLTMLLVDANRVVPADRLIDELWEAALPADPRGALRTQVSRLRRALGPAGGDLATVEGGYRLTVQRSQLDVTRFEDMLAEADEASGQQALRLLDEALALWRGRRSASSPAGRSRWPRRPGSTNCARSPQNAGPNCCSPPGWSRKPSPPCRHSWPNIRNGSRREDCSCRPSTGPAATPKPWPPSGRGAVTWPPNSGWTPRPPCGASNKTSCATRPRRRISARRPLPGHPRCRCR